MKIRIQTSHRKNVGTALAVVVIFMAVSLLILGGTISWCNTSTNLSARNNEYFTTLAAAEAATEKILSRMEWDYTASGEGTVYGNLNTYRSLTPTSAESPLWADYKFTDAQSSATKSYVERLASASYMNLMSQYEGLRGWASTYRVLSNAKNTKTRFGLTGALKQDLQLASIPIFQFAIFYGLDLEINSLTPMTINGRVHSNTDIYLAPSSPLKFNEHVTLVGKITNSRKPGDPSYTSTPPPGSISYSKGYDGGSTFLNLPIGTDNTAAAVRSVIEVPPLTESVTSEMGKQRYYNKAELVIIVNDLGITAFAKQPLGATKVAIPASDIKDWVETKKIFIDQRENKTVLATDLDISKIESWSKGNSVIKSVIGNNKAVNLIYVADQRTPTSTTLPAVRLLKGDILPSRGLTIATPNPLYVQGHYNQPNSSHYGTTNTSATKPASLISDALTILSKNWQDKDSDKINEVKPEETNYLLRKAENTTVNAAILTGIVPTSPGIYSGGVQNLGRFLENWTGTTLTYNGSMVVLFDSIKATAPFRQVGSYYYPPARNFSFDTNFMDMTKQPPGTPELRVLIRGQWAMVKPNTTT